MEVIAYETIGKYTTGCLTVNSNENTKALHNYPR